MIGGWFGMIVKPGTRMLNGWSRKTLRLVSKMRWTTNIALASLLTVSACVPPPVPSVSGDGDYVGTSSRSQFPQRRTCPHSGPLKLHVQSGFTFYRWENQYITVSVLSNGTLSGTLAGVQLTGTHDGTTLEGNVTDGQCWLHFSLRRVAG